MSTSGNNPSAPRPNKPGAKPPQKSGLMRNIGQFVGHVVQGIKSDPQADAAPKPAQPAQPTVRHEVIERIQETPTGPVKIRRTIIEEVHEPLEPGGGSEQSPA